jgi:hypothetical protein
LFERFVASLAEFKTFASLISWLSHQDMPISSRIQGQSYDAVTDLLASLVRKNGTRKDKGVVHWK